MALPRDEQGGGPPVVLLHAGIADRSMWSEHLGPLAAAGLRSLAFDLPGFGEAPVDPRGRPEWDGVLEALDELAIDCAVLVGNSFGAAVALRVALLAPQRVTALVLVSAPPPDLEPSSRLAAAWEAEEAALRRGDTKAAVAAVLDAWLPEAPPALRDRVAAMQRRAFELQAGAEPAEVADPLEADPAQVASIQAPALVAAGEGDMPDFRQGAEALAAALPNAQHALIEGAGHLAPLEAPDAFRDLLLRFLRSRSVI